MSSVIRFNVYRDLLKKESAQRGMPVTVDTLAVQNLIIMCFLARVSQTVMIEMIGIGHMRIMCRSVCG